MKDTKAGEKGVRGAKVGVKSAKAGENCNLAVLGGLFMFWVK